MTKKTMELRPTGMQSRDSLFYEVVRLVNTVDPLIGTILNEHQVKEFIRRPGWTVVIKKGKVK